MNAKSKTKSIPRRFLERVLSSVFLWINVKMADAGYKKEQHLGITFLIHPDAPKNARHVLLGALYLIKELDPLSFRRIPKYLPDGIIALNDNAHQNAFIRIAKPKAAHILDNVIASEKLGMISLEIIRELCRGRLLALGFGDEKEIMRRVETICARRQLKFARKIDIRDGLGDLYEKAYQNSLNRLEETIETDLGKIKARRKAHLQTLRDTKNFPYWFRRFATKRVRKNLKSHPSFQLPSNSGPK